MSDTYIHIQSIINGNYTELWQISTLKYFYMLLNMAGIISFVNTRCNIFTSEMATSENLIAQGFTIEI